MKRQDLEGYLQNFYEYNVARENFTAKMVEEVNEYLNALEDISVAISTDSFTEIPEKFHHMDREIFDVWFIFSQWMILLEERGEFDKIVAEWEESHKDVIEDARKVGECARRFTAEESLHTEVVSGSDDDFKQGD